MEKDVKNMLALTGDKCNVTQSISTKMEVPIIGSAFHRFQLSIRKILAEEKCVVLQVKQLLTKIRTPFISSKLRR